MIARTAESNLSVPEKVGDFEYYTKTLKGKDYPLVLRKNIKTKIEETLLDCNVLAQGQEYFELDGYEISPDQSLLLYSEYYAGGIYAIFVKDLKTQETRLIRKGDVSYAGYTWSADNHTIFLSTHDSAQRPYRVYSYDLLSGAEKLMLEEKDPVFEIESVEKSSDGKYLLISTASKSTSETYFLNLGGREGSLQSFFARRLRRMNKGLGSYSPVRNSVGLSGQTTLLLRMNSSKETRTAPLHACLFCLSTFQRLLLEAH
jgi:oligopeptidase B